jgi:hypothetical protein
MVTPLCARVAESFSEAGEFPHAAVVAAVVVTRGTAQVAVARKTCVARVVEELFAQQHLRRQALGRHRGERGNERHVGRAAIDQRLQVATPIVRSMKLFTYSVFAIG